MSVIDPTARIEPGASIGKDVSIGPFCVVGKDVVLGDGCRLIASAHVIGHTRIGPRTTIHPFAVIGGPPQSIVYKGEPTRLEIGADCLIRESVTMSTGTVNGGGVTRVGDGCFIMAYSHVAHDCQLGNNVIFANATTLAGHVSVESHAFLSGHVAVHQFARIGTGTIISGGSMIHDDIVPFAMVAGAPARLIGINVIGMRRRSFPAASIAAARAAFRGLFLAPGLLAERVATVRAAHGADPAVARMLDFIEAPRKRGICGARRGLSDKEVETTDGI